MGVKDTDTKLRLRIAGHLRRLYEEREYRNVQEMADFLEVDRTTLSRVLRGERTIGLDLLFKVHRCYYVSMDYLCDQDPAAKYLVEPQLERRTVVLGTPLPDQGKD